MGKRRRDIKKRRRLQEVQEQVETAQAEPGLAEEEQNDLLEDHEVFTQPLRDQSEETVPPQGPAISRTPQVDAGKVAAEMGWVGKNKENLLLGMLILYVLLLGLGTMGELYEVEWILNLPIFR